MLANIYKDTKYVNCDMNRLPWIIHSASETFKRKNYAKCGFVTNKTILLRDFEYHNKCLGKIWNYSPFFCMLKNLKLCNKDDNAFKTEIYFFSTWNFLFLFSEFLDEWYIFYKFFSIIIYRRSLGIQWTHKELLETNKYTSQSC